MARTRSTGHKTPNVPIPQNSATSSSIPMTPPPIPTAATAGLSDSSTSTTDINGGNVTAANRFAPLQPIDRPSQDDPNPYHLGTRDLTNFVIVPSPLTTQENFQSWKRAASISINAKNKTAFIDGSLPRPPANDPNHSAWEQCNNMVKAWLLQLVSKEIGASIMYKDRAVDKWNDLHVRVNQSNGPQIFQLKTYV
ncbi:uncharacterized protein LOC133824061 [Humulus lupulus]|uniref:uncharacterized protein LOC133824061 n=1 Tax=Humulus lupulus TaxID=3486 RepID=UPI002B4183E4|nr:uncharacterized protein LOC133824061 [Humulus lupulus]